MLVMLVLVKEGSSYKLRVRCNEDVGRWLECCQVSSVMVMVGGLSPPGQYQVEKIIHLMSD